MALSLGVDLIPNFDKLRSKVNSEKLTVQVDAQDGGVAGAQNNNGRAGILGGIGKTLTAILGVIGVLSQLDVVMKAIGVVMGFVNLGLVKLIQFIIQVGSFLSELPSLISEFLQKGISFLGDLLFDIINKLPGKITSGIKGVFGFGGTNNSLTENTSTFSSTAQAGRDFVINKEKAGGSQNISITLDTIFDLFTLTFADGEKKKRFVI